MNNIFTLIREQLGLTQEQFASSLGVSFTAVNRWENGKALPEKKVQDRLFDFAAAHNIDMMKLVVNRVEKELSELPRKPLSGYFYHGSKSGIHGPVKPCSRKNCDFGPGFYMATEASSPLTLVCDNEDMKFYIVSLDLCKANIKTLEPGFDWAMTVAYCRGKLEKIKGSSFYDKYANMLTGKNIAIGDIADDKMFFVLKNFFEGSITDVALMESLTALRLGLQVVALTDEICEGIKIEKEIKLTYLERKIISCQSAENRKKGLALAEEICKKNRREGRYFDEILKEFANDKF